MIFVLRRLMISLIANFKIRLVCSLVAVGALGFETSAATDNTNNRPSDYYSKDRGVIDSHALLTILDLPSWSAGQTAELVELVSNSAPSRIVEIDNGIKGFAARGAAGNDVVLLVDLKEVLIRERRLVYSVLIRQVLSQGADDNRVLVLRAYLNSASDDEIIGLLGLSPTLLTAKMDDARALGLSLLSVAFGRHSIREGIREMPEMKLFILPVLEEFAASASSEDSRVISQESRRLLAQSGCAAGRRVVQESIERSMNPDADFTSLADSMPETLQLIAVTPGNEVYMESIEKIGANIKRFDHEKLRRGFFANLKPLLGEAGSENDDATSKAIRKYLREQKKSPDKAWALLASNVGG